MQYVPEIIELISERLGAVANSDVVTGDPMQVGAVTLVPISRLGLGLGGAGGIGEGSAHHHKHGKGKGTGGGTGGGAKVRPVAVVVFSPDGVQVLPIPDRVGRIEKLLDKLPELVERFKGDDDED